MIRGDAAKQTTLPYLGVVCMAFAGLLLRTPGTNWRLAAADAFCAALVALAAVFTPWERLPRTAVFALPVAADAVIAALRQAQGGSTSGYGALVFLSAIWVGLVLTRLEVAAITVITALFFTLPIVLVGSPLYPGTGWRAAVLSTIACAVVASCANWVVAAQRRQTTLLRQRTKELDELAAVQSAIANASFDLERVLEIVVGEALQLAGADAATVEVPEGESLIYRATAGDAASQSGRSLPMDGSLSGLAFRTAETVICLDAEHDSRADSETARRTGQRSIVVAPVLHEGRSVGVLKVWSRRTGAIGAETAQALTVLAGLIGPAISRAELLDQLRKQAATDDLTGLPNRRAWHQHLEAALARSKRSGSAVSVIVLDVDGLKAVNDVQGHVVGDKLLFDAAARWMRTVREVDIVGRLGGDEFAVLLEDAGEEAVAEIAARLARADAAVGMRASAGAATWDREESATALLVRADAQMYLEKQRIPDGRSRGRAPLTVVR